MSESNPVCRIREQLGPCVLLAIPAWKKGPTTKAWQELTLDHMTSDYFASFNGEQNIGVSLGTASVGLCTIDVDKDSELEGFLSLNPALQESLSSCGARGANIWIRVKGDYPKSCQIKTNDGQPWGEWRADRNQTVIHGTHPSGCRYRDNGMRPLELDFTSITWPDNLELPWVPKPEPQAPRDIHRELIKKCGPPFKVSGKAVVINENYFVQRFCLENRVIFEQDENQFYLYITATGAWKKSVREVIKERMRLDWERLTQSFKQPSLAFKIGDNLLIPWSAASRHTPAGQTSLSA